ncbi:MAG: ATP-dependent Clp protease ATP-binding subunit [Lactobacillus sp.]|nr:ATP-dependent Clp protease ATP-binding subunit [Lactobacillus sp.]
MPYFDSGNYNFDDLFNELNSGFFDDSSRRMSGQPTRGQMPQQGQNGQQKEKPIGVDLTEQAKEGKYDPVIGRTEVIDQVIEILSRRKKNNPVLTGPAGVGKTSVVEGLAQRIADGDVPEKLKDAHIIELNINELVAGTSLRGSFEEKLKQIIDKAKGDRKTILFIDELHNIVGAGSTDSENNSGDAANILKPALANGDLRVIGATTTSEYQQIEKDPALARRFQPVQVPEPTIEDAIKILEGLAPRYEKYHNVKYDPDALKLAAELSDRYINDRHLPDKAIDLMDEAGAKKSLNMDQKDETSIKNKIKALEAKKDEAAKDEKYDEAAKIKKDIEDLKKDLKTAGKASEAKVTADDLYKLIQTKTGIPMSEINANEAQKNANLAADLKKVVIDQDKAIDIITDAIARKQVFKDSNRPTGSFLLTGPTGVGKTELAKQLAVKLFGSSNALVRLDMSEYQDQMAVNKLIGSAPGYVGYGEGGQLTEKIRHQPYSLILLDEIEKANPQVFNALLQIMDDGRLTDAQGRTISFKDTIIIMTSNAGYSDKLLEGDDQAALRKALEVYFRPEFLNRLDAIVPFNSLTSEDMLKILDLYLNKMEASLAKRDVKLHVTTDAKKYLAKKGYDKEFGARPLRRVVEQDLETPAAKLIVDQPDTKEVKFTIDDKHLYLNDKPIDNVLFDRETRDQERKDIKEAEKEAKENKSDKKAEK